MVTSCEDFRKSVTKKKDKVYAFRKDKDVYTNKKRGSFDKEEVDHVLELQIVRDAYDNWGQIERKRTVKNTVKYALRDSVVNEVGPNLNVTSMFMNRNVKENAVKDFLKDYKHDDIDDREFVDYLRDRKASRADSKRIAKCIVKSYDYLEETLPDEVESLKSGSQYKEGAAEYLDHVHKLLVRMRVF